MLSEDKKVRYAVIGAGWISQIAFMPSAAQTSNSRITAIVSGSPDAAQKLAAFHDVPNVFSYDDYDAMLAGDYVDAVYIALPNSLHADYAIRAAKAGKHALVEKPLAMDVAECEAMIAAANDAGTFLGTAYRLHHDPGSVKALEQIRSGAIGSPRFFSSVFSFQTDSQNHRLNAAHWGGPLQDIGVYCINAARHVFGTEPIEVSAMMGCGGDDPRFADVHEAVSATMRFPEGGFAQFTASFGAAEIDMFRVVGSDGEIVVDPAYQFQTDVAWRLRNARGVTAGSVPNIDHFGAQTAYFSDCILGGNPPESDGHEGLADVTILRAIERSAETGMAQKIDLPPRPSHPSAETVRTVFRTDRRLLL